MSCYNWCMSRVCHVITGVCLDNVMFHFVSVPPEYLPGATGAASVTQASLAQAQNALLSAGSVATAPVYNLANPGASLSVSQPQYNAQIAAIQAQVCHLLFIFVIPKTKLN